MPGRRRARQGRRPPAAGRRRSGDGAEVAWGDTYTDYSVSLTKTLVSGFSASFGLYGTTLKVGQGFGTLAGDDDAFKPVISLKKTFDL